MKKRRAVENHIGTVHALAMGNLCELAAGMCTEVTIPVGMRWIPRGMTIEYLAKARNRTSSATARLDKTEWTGPENVGVPVTVTDATARKSCARSSACTCRRNGPIEPPAHPVCAQADRLRGQKAAQSPRCPAPPLRSARRSRASQNPPCHARSGNSRNTLPPFLALWVAMAWTRMPAGVTAWTLLLALPTAALYVRLFILQHDCGHGSFFASARANRWLGAGLGLLTLFPFAYWKKTHGVHHATSGNLDKRVLGDIRTLTVQRIPRLLAPGCDSAIASIAACR